MADDGLKRLDIGFAGGSVLSVRTRQSAYDALVGALADDGAARWHELNADDSVLKLDLAQIVYVQRETEGERVGF
jgi:hypothetical protein